MSSLLDYAKLQEYLGYEFHDKTLLKQALTHSSRANEELKNKAGDYERLEFLGDAVVELVSSAFLFKAFPELPEGELTKRRAVLVCESSLAKCARAIHVSDYVLLGRGEENSGLRDRDALLCDVFEALVGAVYLDSGLEEAEKIIKRLVLADVNEARFGMDAKSILVEKVQSLGLGDLLHYETISETGPEHNKLFMVEVSLDGKVLGSGQGHSKKAAQQKAAAEALKKGL